MAAPLLEHYRVFEEYRGLPLYTGGVMDAWPGQVVDAIQICRQEVAAVKAYLAAEDVRNKGARTEVRHG